MFLLTSDCKNWGSLNTRSLYHISCCFHSWKIKLETQRNVYQHNLWPSFQSSRRHKIKRSDFVLKIASKQKARRKRKLESLLPRKSKKKTTKPRQLSSSCCFVDEPRRSQTRVSVGKSSRETSSSVLLASFSTCFFFLHAIKFQTLNFICLFILSSIPFCAVASSPKGIRFVSERD